MIKAFLLLFLPPPPFSPPLSPSLPLLLLLPFLLPLSSYFLPFFFSSLFPPSHSFSSYLSIHNADLCHSLA